MKHWKICERRIAELLGGTRLPVSGRAREANEEANRLNGIWHERRYVASDIEIELESARKERAALEEEKLPEERGAVVRSVWQEAMRKAIEGAEPEAQDAPALAWGSANVGDRPLSAGAAPKENVVIPTALQQSPGVEEDGEAEAVRDMSG